MTSSKVLVQALVIMVAVGMAGCGGGVSPITPLSNTSSIQFGAIHKPGAVKARAYQWVAQGDEVVQYDYPKSDSPIGAITGFDGATGICSTGKHTFWVVNGGPDEIVQYDYSGKKVLKTLALHADYPSACAVSQSDGDVAVIVSYTDVVVFKHGRQGQITTYALSGMPYFMGYDATGNLYVDGFNGQEQGALLELAAGGTAFENVTLPNEFFPGSIQWDGKYVAVTDQAASAVDRYTIANYAAKLEATVTLSGADDCASTWIAKPYIFCADAGKEAIGVYTYPAGGQAIATLGDSAYVTGAIVQVSR